ncbi:MAG: TfoX/Sxy family protein [Clostridia bacterium]|nr:TfoX/Sxy family protein [Clostridia bacterium]
MATSKEYLSFLLEQLSDLDGIGARSMMGEYILYLNGKIAAYVCDERLLVKPTPSARSLMPDAPLEPPYPGAKEMLLVEDVENREFLNELFHAIEDELPLPKPKNKRKGEKK